MENIWTYISLTIGVIGFPMSFYSYYTNRRLEEHDTDDSAFVRNERQRQMYRMFIYGLFLIAGVFGLIFAA